MVLGAIAFVGFAMTPPVSYVKEPSAPHSIKLFLSPLRGCSGRGRAFKIRNISTSKVIEATIINSRGVHEDFTLSPLEVRFVSCEQHSSDLSAIAYAVTRASYIRARRNQR